MAAPKTVRLMIADIRDELDGKLDAAIAALLRRKERHEAEGYTNLEIDMDWTESYGNTSVEVELYGERMETDAEAEKRERLAEQNLRNAEAYARRQYEALKAQFG